MRDRRGALFLGRFQPPSIAHACTVQAMLRSWGTVIVVVVRAGDARARVVPGDWGDFARVSEANFRPEKNPFTPEEVRDMWKAHINANSLEGRVECVINVRPHLDPDFNTTFPPDRTVLVYPVAGASENRSDKLREQVIGRALNREMQLIRPDFMLHVTEIKRRVAEGGSWEQYIATGAYPVFMRLCGPERLRAAQ